jgi:hypothetical protein
LADVFQFRFGSKQVTTAAKIGLTVKEPFVIRMGDFAIDEEQ